MFTNAYTHKLLQKKQKKLNTFYLLPLPLPDLKYLCQVSLDIVQDSSSSTGIVLQ